MNDVVKVGIADMNIAKSPQNIRTVGLGSCVGVVVYDLALKTAALGHVMLPCSAVAKGQKLREGKFADTAVEKMVECLKESGSTGTLLQAKIAGGAHMFHAATTSEMMRVGSRNIEAVKKELHRLKITLKAEDVGGKSGRTIEFFPETGVMRIKTVNKGTFEI